MAKCKICFISYYAYSLFRPELNLPFGGAEVQLFFLAGELAKDKNYEVSFLVGDFNQPMTEKFGSISVHKTFIKRPAEVKWISGIHYALLLFLKIRKLNCDIYVQRAAGAETGLVALACRLNGKKFVYMTASDIDCNRQYIAHNGLVGRLYWLGLKLAHKVITQNTIHQQLLLQNHGVHAQIIKSSFYFPKRRKLNRDLILYVATRLEPNKKTELFLSLAKKFPDQKFVLVGKSVSTHQTYSDRIVSQTLLIPNLHYFPILPLKQADDYFSRAKIFVSTSDFEGFPASFAQSLVHGCPIVSLRVNPDNFLDDYACGFCANGDYTKFVAYTQLLLTNSSKWISMSRNAYSYARQNHDLNVNSFKFKAILNEICAA